MPIQAEFEEKTYEIYFGHEMARLVRYAYSPGQVAETYLGFDAAYHLFWDELPWPYLPFWSQTLWEEPGFSLHDWTEILEEHFSHVPDVRFNLFVQFKRPERIIDHRGAEWAIWRAPYYRYEIREHQQNILSALDEHSGNRATVIYASPACIELQTLFRLSTENQIISESNIALVESLHNHNRYTYIAPGTRV